MKIRASRNRFSNILNNLGQKLSWGCTTSSKSSKGGTVSKRLETSDLSYFTVVLIQMIENLLNLEEIEKYRKLYDDLLSGKIDFSSHRHDFGSHAKKKCKHFLVLNCF